MAAKRIEFGDIVLATTNEQNEAVYALLSTFLEPMANGVVPTGAFANHYKWEAVEKWLTEQMGTDDIGARTIEWRDADYVLTPQTPLELDLSHAERDFQLRLNAVRNGTVILPYSVDFGMPVIDFINPHSKKKRANLMSQEEFAKKMSAHKKKISRDAESEEEESEEDSDERRKKDKAKKRKKAAEKKKDKGENKVKPARPSKDADSSSNSSSRSEDENDVDKNKSKKKRKTRDKSDDEDDVDRNKSRKKRKDQNDGDKTKGREKKNQEQEGGDQDDESDDEGGNENNGGKKPEEARGPANSGSPANEPIKLNEDDADEVDVNKAIFEHIGGCPKLEGDTYWDAVCLFFDKEPDDAEEFKIPGLKSALLPHQATIVFWVFARIQSSILSAGIADDMGLGKTYTTFAILMIFSHLQSAQVKVKESQNSNERPIKKKHCLPNTANGRQCPSQREITRDHGIQCPCVPGSLSKCVVQAMECLPSLIIVPPNLLPGWVAEWEKFVEPPPNAEALNGEAPKVEAPNLRLYVLHGDYKNTKYNKGGDYNYIVDSTTSGLAAHAEAIWVEVPDRTKGKKGTKNMEVLEVRRCGHDNASNKVILTTAKMSNNFNKNFIRKATWEAPDKNGNNKVKKDHPSSQLACSFVIFDEIHQNSIRSAHFDLLKVLMDQNLGPTMAVGLSGSLLASDPSGWEALLHHAFQFSSERLGENLVIGPMTETNFEEQFQILCRNWNFLQNHMLLEGADDAKRMKINRAIADVRAACCRVDGGKCIIGDMVVGRKKSETFRGNNILGLKPVNSLVHVHTIPKGKPRAGIRRLCRGVRAFVNENYKTKKAKWDKDFSGKEPNEADIGYALMRNQAQSSVGPKSIPSYFRLHQCAVFPFLTRLYHRLDPKAFQAENIAKLALAYTRELSLGNRTKEQLVAKLQDSPYWKHRENLIYHSFKFQTLQGIIQKLVDLKNKPQEEQPDDGPEDGSNVRNLVVFTESPLSAYLTAMLLVHVMGDEVEPLLIHRDVTEAPQVTFPNHYRAGIRQHFDADCRHGAKNKILIGTYGLLATGHNLQARTNHAVLMDVATETDRTQAITRLHRLGQRLEVTVHQLWDRRNLFEAQRMMHIGGFKQLLPRAAFDRNDYVNWKYYTDDDDLRDLSASTDGRGNLSPAPEVRNLDPEVSEAEEPVDSPSPFRPSSPATPLSHLRLRWKRLRYAEDDEDDEDGQYGDGDDDDDYL